MRSATLERCRRPNCLRRSPWHPDGFVTKVRLFDMGETQSNQSCFADLRMLCERRRLRIDASGYSPGSLMYSVHCRSEEDVDALSKLLSVRSISHMPTLHIVRTQSMKASAMPDLPVRQPHQSDVPVVAVVDSGVSRTVPKLESWVVGRDSQVPPEYSSPKHGTFVPGLICFGGLPNPAINGLDDNPCAVFDLQVIPNDDPDHLPR